MSHAFAGGGGDAGDEADDRFAHVFARPFGGGFFVVAADFADHDDGAGVRVLFEFFQYVTVFEAVDGVAADADAGGLAQAHVGDLLDGFVGEGAGAGDDADVAFAVDVAGHDADFDLAGGDDAGTVGAD